MGTVVGGVIGAVVGGITGFVKSKCIIVTACTDPYSHEVEIARQYRDAFLDDEQLRGYYALAEKIVPTLERSETIRTFTKKYLVDPLVAYGEWKLGLQERPSAMSILISKVFLSTIKTIGYILPRYVRADGEVF